MREAMTDAELAALPEPTGHGPWSPDMHLLASISDGVQILAWQQSLIHGGKQKTPPDPIRRPGVSKPGSVLTGAQAEFLQQLRDERRTE